METSSSWRTLTEEVTTRLRTITSHIVHFSRHRWLTAYHSRVKRHLNCTALICRLTLAVTHPFEITGRGYASTITYYELTLVGVVRWNWLSSVPGRPTNMDLSVTRT